VNVHLGDCLAWLATLPECSVDAVVTDPPYELTSGKKGGTGAASLNVNSPAGRSRIGTGGGFMGKTWDATGIAHSVDFWREVFRVLKPGGHLVAFGGTRTVHRLTCAVEDAGFEVRDTLHWTFFSGFPKSCDVSKQIDEQERRHWLNVCKAIDSLDQSAMLEAWKSQSEPAPSAALTNSRKRRASSALVPAAPHPSGDGSPASAPTAAGSSTAHPLTIEASSPSAPSPAAESSTASFDPATTAESRPASRAATPDTMGSSAPCDASGCRDASTAPTTKAVEALLIWLGSEPSSKREASTALYAALTDWKRITSSRSGPTRNSGTSSATGCACATTATTTGFTAESLISSTVATARSEAEARAAGAEREVVGVSARHGGGIVGNGTSYEMSPCIPTITAPATPEAARWSGWGTAVKPAIEPALLARKPLDGTVASNIQRWGTGALNIDGCRLAPGDVAWVGPDDGAEALADKHESTRGLCSRRAQTTYSDHDAPRIGTAHTGGRWPANLYYCPKASRAERERGTDGLPARSGAEAVDRDEGTAGLASPRTGAGRSADAVRNFHPTVKPVRLMRWLCRLVTPPGGLIAEPFAGSGTTLVAGALEGFRVVGAEREPEYHAIAVARAAHAARWPASWADTAPGFTGEADDTIEQVERLGQVAMFGGAR
jgi:DNA modification methylase